MFTRQVLVLAAIVRSRRFLRQPAAADRPARDRTPVFFVIVPVLREAGVIAEAIDHLGSLAHGHAAQVMVVTTAREAAEAERHTCSDTVAIVEELAGTGKFVHLHYPDPAGLKGDQLNFAAAYCASTLLSDVPASDAFMICYDADSRPPLDSLTQFEHAIAVFPDASVFHQSSRFELRAERVEGHGRRLSQLISDGGALRANRFVLGFEIPRLVNRSAAMSRFKRAACSYVYAHVTGHGLGLRLSLLADLPFPRRSPLEDMHYSFYLGSRNLPMVAVPSLDRAEVPDSVRAQIQQAARWFFGPSRALRYLRDPATRSGWRAWIMAASALGSSVEWLGCAIVPPLAAYLLFRADGLLQALAGGVVAVYVMQLVLTENALGSPDPLRQRMGRLLACPLAAMLFGVGGFMGAIRLLRGGSGVGKTERQHTSSSTTL